MTIKKYWKLKYTPYYPILRKTGLRIGYMSLIFVAASGVLLIASWINYPSLFAFSILSLLPGLVLFAYLLGLDNADKAIYKSQHDVNKEGKC